MSIDTPSVLPLRAELDYPLSRVSHLFTKRRVADRTLVSPSRTVQSKAMPELDRPGARLIGASGDSPT